MHNQPNHICANIFSIIIGKTFGYLNFFLITFSIAFNAEINCQTKTSYNNFFIDKYSVVPALAGFENEFKISSAYRKDWAGFERAPTLLNFHANAPINFKTSWGLDIVNEKAGIFQSSVFSGSYAFNFRPKYNQRISLGLTLSLLREGITTSDAKMETYNKTIATNGNSSIYGFTPNFSVVYQINEFQSGLVVSNLFYNKLNSGASEIKLPRRYQFHADYKYFIHDGLFFEPSIFLVNQFNNWLFYFSATSSINNNFWMGLSYSSESLLGVMFGCKLNKTLKVNYSFNANSSPVYQYSYGSHEITLLYAIGYTSKLRRIKQNLHERLINSGVPSKNLNTKDLE